MPARKKVDPGWLRLQRERYGPEFRVPPSRSLHHAGDLVGDVLKGLGLEASAKTAEFQACWPEIAGRANALHSRPGRWEKGVLTVYVDHHLWLNELKRTASASLLKRLQERFGKRAVRQLRFEMTPEEER